MAASMGEVGAVKELCRFGANTDSTNYVRMLL